MQELGLTTLTAHTVKGTSGPLCRCVQPSHRRSSGTRLPLANKDEFDDSRRQIRSRSAQPAWGATNPQKRRARVMMKSRWIF